MADLVDFLGDSGRVVQNNVVALLYSLVLVTINISRKDLISLASVGVLPIPGSKQLCGVKAGVIKLVTHHNLLD